MVKGFTLVETMVVIAVIVFLSGLSYFSFSSISRTLDINYAAKQVFSDMRLTQDLARTVHYPHQIEFTKGKNEYQIVNLDNEEKAKSDRISEKLMFDGKEIFIFSSSGNPVAGGSGTLIIVNKKGFSKKIVVSPAGRIRIE